MKILGDEKYSNWVKTQSRRMGARFGINADDLLQQFYVSLLEGQTSKFEQVWLDYIRREYNRGITGVRQPVRFSLDETLLKRVRANQGKMSDTEFIEYLLDLRTLVSEAEFKVVWLAVVGFGKGEIFEQTEDLTRRELEALWKRLGISEIRTGTGTESGRQRTMEARHA